MSTELCSWFDFFVGVLPSNYLCNQLRSYYWQRKLKTNNKVLFRRHAYVTNPSLVTIGNEVICGDYVSIDPNNSKGIFIGNSVALSNRVFIRGGNHAYTKLDTPILKQGHDCVSINYRDKEYSVIIEDDVWIGANSIILSGSMIGKGSVIVAGTVISFIVPPYAIVAGNPGCIIGSRLDEATKTKCAINLFS